MSKETRCNELKFDENGVKLLQKKIDIFHAVSAISWNTVGHKLIIGSWDRTIKLFDLLTGDETILKGHTKLITSLDWSPVEDIIVSASQDESIKIWSGVNYSLIKDIEKPHKRAVSFVNWAPDGERFLTASWDSTIKLWSGKSLSPMKTLKGHDNALLAAVWSADGKYIGSGGWDRNLIVWDVSKGTKVQEIKNAHKDAITSVTWHPSGKYIATGSLDKSAKIWDVNEAKPIKIFDDYKDAVKAVSWSHDGKYIAIGSWDTTVKIFKTDSWELVKELKTGSWNNIIRWCPVTYIIAVAGEDGQVALYDIRDIE